MVTTTRDASVLPRTDAIIHLHTHAQGVKLYTAKVVLRAVCVRVCVCVYRQRSFQDSHEGQRPDVHPVRVADLPERGIQRMRDARRRITTTSLVRNAPHRLSNPPQSTSHPPNTRPADRYTQHKQVQAREYVPAVPKQMAPRHNIACGPGVNWQRASLQQNQI